MGPGTEASRNVQSTDVGIIKSTQGQSLHVDQQPTHAVVWQRLLQQLLLTPDQKPAQSRASTLVVGIYPSTSSATQSCDTILTNVAVRSRIAPGCEDRDVTQVSRVSRGHGKTTGGI